MTTAIQFLVKLTFKNFKVTAFAKFGRAFRNLNSSSHMKQKEIKYAHYSTFESTNCVNRKTSLTSNYSTL